MLYLIIFLEEEQAQQQPDKYQAQMDKDGVTSTAKESRETIFSLFGRWSDLKIWCLRA